MFKKPEDGFDTFAPENVSPLVGWLASPLAANVSGQVFVIWAKNITLATRPKLDTKFESPERWTVESLQQLLGPHFEKLEPVKDAAAPGGGGELLLRLEGYAGSLDLLLEQARTQRIDLRSLYLPSVIEQLIQATRTDNALPLSRKAAWTVTASWLLLLRCLRHLS